LIVKPTVMFDGSAFDAQHGVLTEIFIPAVHEPTPVAVCEFLLARVPTDFVKRATFVDVGSGMGRVVLLAAQYAYRRVVGVERRRRLFATSRENIAIATGLVRKTGRLDLINCDITEYAWPAGDLVIFMFNPFGPELVRDTLARALESRTDRDRVKLLFHPTAYAPSCVRIETISLPNKEDVS
jgi:predicted RNA methylase